MAASRLHLQESEEDSCCVQSSPILKATSSNEVCTSSTRLLSPSMSKESNVQQIKTDPPSGARPYSLLQSRVMTQTVAMLYFAGYICTNSLMPQYIVHRLTSDGRGMDNSSQSVKTSPCDNLSDSSHVDGIQSQASQQVLYYTLAASVPSLLTCLIAGGYSDTFGRRPLLMLGLFSGLIKVILTSIIIRCVYRNQKAVLIF
ncbi:solute carrier family 46 member 3-like [Plakobranchus ocellatus]|uniref:Solute carrier family 46 member 3-like n=1 Tax=Plakobranchus ocellatus TaxID=259542 RepID=A0AAV4BDZ0_9GAST|nr:solute carrier family 46 member 3-like [Plakobranchus ocellatus]